MQCGQNFYCSNCRTNHSNCAMWSATYTFKCTACTKTVSETIRFCHNIDNDDDYYIRGKLELEGTTCGKSCSKCNGSEKLTCSSCNGGKTKTCASCSGSGTKSCSTCNGQGTTTNTNYCSHSSWASHYTCSNHGKNVSQYH